MIDRIITVRRGHESKIDEPLINDSGCRFGRRLIVLGGSAMVIILGFASAFSPNFIFYSIVRFFVGFFIPIASAHKIVLASEFVDTKHRPYFVLPIGIAFGFSACLLGLLAYFIRTWKYLLIACTAPFSLTFIFYWYVETKGFDFQILD